MFTLVPASYVVLVNIVGPLLIGVVYVWIAIVVLFSLWAPDTFPTWTTVKSVLNQNAIAGLVALALVVPLSARIFDLSVGSAMVPWFSIARPSASVV